jgi:DNA gyrase subunit A
MVNLLQLDEGERVTSILPLEEPAEDRFIFMATARGYVKKTDLTSFAPRSAGLRAIVLEEGDVLVGTAITDGSQDVMLFSSEGKAMRFREDTVRPMGRASRGVRGISLHRATHDCPAYRRRQRHGAHRQRERLRQAHGGE